MAAVAVQESRGRPRVGLGAVGVGRVADCGGGGGSGGGGGNSGGSGGGHDGAVASVGPQVDHPAGPKWNGTLVRNSRYFNTTYYYVLLDPVPLPKRNLLASEQNAN